MSPGAREIRSGQAKGESSWRQKMRLLLASAPFFTTFPWCLLSSAIYLGGGGYAKDGGKRGAPCGLSWRWATGKGFSPVGCVNCEQSCGKSMKKCLEKKKEETLGTMEGALRGHRDALWIPKAAGLKSTSPPKYSIWPFVVLAQQRTEGEWARRSFTMNMNHYTPRNLPTFGHKRPSWTAATRRTFMMSQQGRVWHRELGEGSLDPNC